MQETTRRERGKEQARSKVKEIMKGPEKIGRREAENNEKESKQGHDKTCNEAGAKNNGKEKMNMINSVYGDRKQVR